MRLGLAETFQSETVAHLKNCFFSLNIDESTSENYKRVLTVLVSYYSPVMKTVIVEHLASVSLVKVDSASVYSEICKIMESNQIPWSNLISVLMDSCAVMRGSKSGVELRLREKAPHLLDIDGDTCHHVHNTVRQFCKPFDYHVEGLFGDLHSDFKWSTDLQGWLDEICLMLGLKFTMPDRFISHRWLSVLDVSISTLRLIDAYTVFYYGFLGKDDRRTYLALLCAIYHKRSVSSEARERIREIYGELQKKTKTLTTEGTNRKLRIIQKLFHNRPQTQLILHFFAAVLPVFKRYVLLIEMKEPKIHKLHDEQVDLVKEFLSYFVKPELLSTIKPEQMKSLKVDDKQNQLHVRDVFMGDTTRDILKEMRNNDSVRRNFESLVQDAYTKCGQYLQKKMPFDSFLLKAISCIDPLVRGHTLCNRYMSKLPGLVKVLTKEEKESFAREVFKYQIDNSLPAAKSDDDKEVRLDVWWTHVFNTGKYPALSKLVN